jgi:uncharacterized protein involved in response to NO
VPRATTHSDFDPTPVAAAITLALVSGFGSGVVMIGGIAGWWPVGGWWSAVRQVHGHVQLFGWIALFVFGVGSFFLPRARGAALAFPSLLPWIAASLGGGVFLRAASQIALALSVDRPALLFRAGFAVSGILEVGGVLTALVLFGATFRGGRPMRERIHLRAVAPLLAAAFLSLAVASVLSAAGAAHSAIHARALVDPLLDRCTVDLMIFGFALPATQAVSAQTFPLFLRLPVPGRSAVIAFAICYLASVATLLAGTACGLGRIEGAGAVGVAASLIGFTLLLDILTRRRTPWVASRKPAALLESRRPTRPGLPDRGEYGRFEWLVSGAYAWLTVGAILLGINGVADLLGRDPPVSPDAARHAITMGFLTLLIVGMAVRMIPGFVRGRLAFPSAVAALAIGGNAAAACRVLPLLLPLGRIGDAALGASGLLAWGCIALLAGMLGTTWRRARRA